MTTNASKNKQSYALLCNRLLPKLNQLFSDLPSMIYMVPKVHENSHVTFRVFVIINKQTNELMGKNITSPGCGKGN